MTEARRARFIAAQIAGLRELGLDETALAREEEMLRHGFAQSAVLARLFAADLPAENPS